MWRFPVAAALAAVAAGCFDLPDAFECTRDDQCGEAGVAGFCEPGARRYCSLADGACPSGRRYRVHAGDGLGGLCVGAALSDGGGGDGAGVPDGGGACPMPQLLVAVEDLQPPLASAVGEILRFSLAGGGTPTPCDPLTASGGLGALVDAVGFLPPNLIAAASRDKGYQVIDADTDMIRFSFGPALSNTNPIDIVPFTSPTDGPVAGVGLAEPGGWITDVDVFKEGIRVQHFTSFDQPPALPAFGAQSLTRSLLDPHRLFGITGASGNIAANDIDPWANPPTSTSYVDNTTPSMLATIYSLAANGLRRTVWVGLATNGIYYVEENDGHPSIGGPLQCATPPKPCVFSHAVPDPTAAGRFIALCNDSSQPAGVYRGAHLLRLDGRACTSFFDGDAGLKLAQRMYRLAIAP